MDVAAEQFREFTIHPHGAAIVTSSTAGHVDHRRIVRRNA
jgi:hypothetical protein